MTFTFTISDSELYWIWHAVGFYLTLKCIHSFLEMRTAYYGLRLARCKLQIAELRAARPDSSIED